MTAVTTIKNRPTGRQRQRQLCARPRKAKRGQNKERADADAADGEFLTLTRSTTPVQYGNRFYAGGTSGALPASATPVYLATNHSGIDDVQMFADFFENYYPSSLHLWRNITYLRTLVDLVPSTPVLERARRTIGLVHLASATQDARLVREARVSYGRLLGMLQFTLAFPWQIRTAQETRELVAAIALLTHISDVHPSRTITSRDADDSWASHLQAAQALFSTYAPLSLPGVDHLDRGLMRHTLMNGFFLALAKRKPWIVDPAWLVGIKSIGWTEMVQACHNLPGLLAETDKALASRIDTVSLVRLVARLEDARIKTRALYPGTKRPALLTSSSCAPALHVEAEEHVVMAESTAFPELYAPLTGKGLAEALKLCFKSMLQLIVECAILRIWHFRPETLFAAPKVAWASAEEGAYAMARELCKVALSFTQNDKLVHATTLRLMLMLCRNIFEEQDRRPELGWCEACLIANQLRIRRISASGAPTLCKVEDITPGIVEAGKYSRRFDPKAFVIRGHESGGGMRLMG